MSMQVTVNAAAKLNLTLDVTGKRADGYHDLESIMQSIDCYDTVTAETTASGIELTVLPVAVCPPEKNTAYRAAQVFFDETGVGGGVRLTLTKRIPQQAGMGGGSADAAAVLTALDKLYDTCLSVEELCRLGLQVGADVPFCVVGGTAMVTGIGDVVNPLPSLPDCVIVVAQPTDGVSTAAAYAALDAAPMTARPDNAAATAALRQGDLVGVCKAMSNVFEAATALDGVCAIRARMATFSPLSSMMTGSGSAVFAVFTDEKTANDCAKMLAREFPTAFVCRPCRGNKIV